MIFKKSSVFLSVLLYLPDELDGAGLLLSM